jgi:hypothetical protein
MLDPLHHSLARLIESLFHLPLNRSYFVHRGSAHLCGLSPDLLLGLFPRTRSKEECDTSTKKGTHNEGTDSIPPTFDHDIGNIVSIRHDSTSCKSLMGKLSARCVDTLRVPFSHTRVPI